MKIKGAKIYKKNNCWICYIEEFSDELKEIIRANLKKICYGINDASAAHTYKNTLVSFFTRYDDKTQKQQKGMLGELLAHVVLTRSISNLLRASVLFNKEERSMKKGFDIIFLDVKNNAIWYSEVKSGELRNGDSTRSNLRLLSSARAGIEDKFNSRHSYLWDNALFDARLTTRKQIFNKLKSLLDHEYPSVEQAAPFKGNAILISVLYSPLSNKIDSKSLDKMLNKIIKKNKFRNVIIYSIQKETFNKIERFLKQEKDA